LPSAHLHPEFGYFCPSPRFRRKAWAVVAFIVIGSIAGASGILSMADRDVALLVAHADDVLGAETGSQAGRASVAAALPAAAAPGAAEGGKTVVANPPAAKTTAVKTVATKMDALKADAVKSDGVKMDAVKPACEETTWSYLDGKCVSGNARKPRVVRVPTNRPAIAAIPLGRAAAAPESAKGDLSKSAQAKSAQVKSAQVKSAQATPAQAAPVADAAASAAATDASQPLAAASKKPQKTAHSQNRPSWREVRVDPQAARGPATGPEFHPLGGFFSLFR
jgi:hypothetical protein